MDPSKIMALAIGFTCVGVFIATSVITVLALAGVIRLEADVRNQLYKVLIVEIVVISVAAFARLINVNVAGTEQQVEELRDFKQTVQANQDKPPGPGPAATAAGLKPRVYFHIRNETQRSTALRLSAALQSATDSVVPGIQKVESGPGQNELRYFRNSERPQAQALADALKVQGLNVDPKYVPGFEKSSAIRPDHYELWMAAN